MIIKIEVDNCHHRPVRQGRLDSSAGRRVVHRKCQCSRYGSVPWMDSSSRWEGSYHRTGEGEGEDEGTGGEEVYGVD